MGAAAAWSLAQRGRDVVLLERFAAGHTNGGSHGSARIFRFGYIEPDYVDLAAAALPLWRELEAAAGVELLVTTGAVDHGGDELVAMADLLVAKGLRAEWLAPDHAAERWPGMRFDGRVLLQPDGGRIDADATVAALHRVAADVGADVRTGERVRAVETITDARVFVTTDLAEYEAGIVVVATGAWTQELMGPAQDLGITVTQEQPAQFAPLDASADWPSFVHRGAAGQVAMYGLGTPQGAVKVGEHGSGHVVHPDRTYRSPDPAGVERLSRYVEQWLPGLDPTPTDVMSCLYDTTPAYDFIIDRAGRIVIAAGFSGHGFKFVPAIGRMVADLADGAEQTVARFRI